MGPLNQEPIRLTWIPWSPELHSTPDDERIGPFGDVWRPWGSNSEVTGSPAAIWVGPQIIFSTVFASFVCKTGPLLKNSLPYPKSFWFWRGLTLGPPKTSAPTLGQIPGACLGEVPRYKSTTFAPILLFHTCISIVLVLK